MRQLDVNMIRKESNIINIFDRIKHKKECVTSNKRVFNKLSKEIGLAVELLKNGKLKAEFDCVAIRDLETLRYYKELVKNKREYVLDMETTGLDIFNDIIVGMCIYVDGVKSAYIPINHTDIDNNRLDNQLTEEEVLNEWREIFEDEGISHIFHNAKYDYKVILWNWGVKIKNVYFDTLIGGFLLNENEPHGLKPLYNKYILKGEGDDLDFGDYFGKTPFNYIPIEVATIYGANDGVKTYRLYQFQRQYLTRTHRRADFCKLAEVMFKIEMPLIPILADIEIRGVEIREDYARELGKELREELDEVIKKLDFDVEGLREDIEKCPELQRLMGEENKLNYSSPQQLQMLFYNVLKFKSMDRKNPRGTGEDIVKKLKEVYKVDFLDNLLRYRELKKLLETYVEKLPKIVELKTGAVHTQFNQLGAKTGRFSSSDKVSKLNLQNIPSKETRIRKIFRAREGCYFVGGDFSQIEPRTLASMSGDIKMIEAYKNGVDLYSLMASDLYGYPVEECKEFREDGSVNKEGKERRTSVKSILLGLMYGRGDKSIAEQIGKSEREAIKIKEKFFEGFPVIKEYQQKVIYKAEKLGYVSTLFGRKRRLPDMKLDRNSFEYQRAFRQTINSVIQGTAGDIMKLTMIEIFNNKRVQELGIKMIMTIHDELICEVPKENVVEGKKLIEELMKLVGERALGLPMKVDCEITDIWYGDSIEIEED